MVRIDRLAYRLVLSGGVLMSSLLAQPAAAAQAQGAPGGSPTPALPGGSPAPAARPSWFRPSSPSSPNPWGLASQPTTARPEPGAVYRGQDRADPDPRFRVLEAEDVSDPRAGRRPWGQEAAPYRHPGPSSGPAPPADPTDVEEETLRRAGAGSAAAQRHVEPAAHG